MCPFPNSAKRQVITDTPSSVSIHLKNEPIRF